MGYLIPTDFNRLIQDVSLQQIISGNEQLKVYGEQAALEEIKSYLRAKYDIETEFGFAGVYNPNATYTAGQRVYLDAPAYSSSSTYILKQLVLQAGIVYQCSTAIPVAEPFNASKWTSLGAQYDLFYGKYPYPVFNLKTLYSLGNQIIWRNKLYTARMASTSLSHDAAVQYASTTNFPYANIFPDAVGSSTFWTDNGAYIIPIDSLTNPAKFTLGDNRNQMLVLYLLDILIYHLYRRIPPAIVPEIRILAYQTAISWLNKVAKGEDVIADITLLQTTGLVGGFGGRIRYGSVPKQINSY